MRFGSLVVALMSGVGIAGCSLFHRDVREWAGVTLGEPPPKGAAPDAMSFNHAIAVRTGEGFPWQDGARAQLDAQGRVMAVTLQTACCEMLPQYYQPLSEEDLAAFRRKERAIPDRYRENIPPPGAGSVPTRDVEVTRYISWRDMIAYGRAAIRKASERLGPPASIGRERGNGGSGLSYIEGPDVLRAHWRRSAGSPIDAVLDIGLSRNCMTAAAPDIRHPQIGSGCGGLDLSCYRDWYPPVPQPAPSQGAVLVAPPPSPPAPPTCKVR
jgi:hypothetical protein